MRLLKQSSTQDGLFFLLVDSTDHVTGKTGVTPTVTISKAGGSYATPSGAVTEIANGVYKVAGNATDTNTLGPLLLHATGTGCDPVDVEYQVVAFDPHDGGRLGLTSLPSPAAGAAGGVGDVTRYAGNPVTPSVNSGIPLVSIGYFEDVGLGQAYTLDVSTEVGLNLRDVSNDVVLSLPDASQVLSGVVTLAASQPNYAPAKAGDAMILTAAYDAAKTAAQASDYTSARAAKLDNLDATISSRLAESSYTTPPTKEQIASQVEFQIMDETDGQQVLNAIAAAVWDEVQSGHTTAGTFGLYLDSPVSDAGGGGVPSDYVIEATDGYSAS